MKTGRHRDPDAERQRPQGAGRKGRRPRVVVVEDEFVVLLSLADLLESLGCEVVGTAQDADSAVKVVRSLRPDLVFMDLALGDSDVVAATRTITTETAARVIIVTAYEEARTQAVKAAGATGVLTKPVQAGRLAAVIAELTRSPAAAPATEPASRSPGGAAGRRPKRRGGRALP